MTKKEQYFLAYDALNFYAIFGENFPHCDKMYDIMMEIVCDYEC